MSSNKAGQINTTKISEFETQAKLCQSLTHPFRLRIIQILEDGEKNVKQIQELTNRPQPFISQHLKILRNKGIVSCRRAANAKYYTLSDLKILEVCKLISEIVKTKKKPKINE